MKDCPNKIGSTPPSVLFVRHAVDSHDSDCSHVVLRAKRAVPAGLKESCAYCSAADAAASIASSVKFCGWLWTSIDN